MPTAFVIKQCQLDECGFRFPESVEGQDSGKCPLCNGSTEVVVGPFEGHEPATRLNRSYAPVVAVLLDNIRSSHNVGSIFRTCDGAGIHHVHLCGITSTPKQTKVRKTALGADQSMPWTYYRNGVKAAHKLKHLGYDIWTLESTDSSQSLFDVGNRALPERIVLVAGNERCGVDPGIVALSERIVSVPMSGVKNSLNVSVALGVAIYWLRHGNR